MRSRQTNLGYRKLERADKTVRLNVKRQDRPESQAYWEEFELQLRPGMNVICALMEIALNPVNLQGKQIAPIVYDSNCLEEACGSCAMLINGQAAMACSSLVDKLEQPIRLEPLSRFPVVRDLSVDRGVLFENLKRVHLWVPIDGTYPLGPGPRIDPAVQELAYPLSRCMSCTLCMEVCSQFNESTHFVGAAIINQVRLFNMHPTGAHLRHQRLEAMTGDGGIHECSFAGNCVQICPKNIPLTTSISIVNGQVMRQSIGDLLQKPEPTSAKKKPGHR